MIETEGLTKDFGDFRAVDGLTLRVEPGTVLALLGPNGAGKTTTVRMLTSILRPTAGRAIVAGYDVVKEAVQVRAHVGVLTEHHGLYLRMRALDYLEFFGRVYHIPKDVRRKRAVELMHRFGLGNDIDRRLGEYSKGMRQKLALVRALLHDPPVLLLDEPTSAMDPGSARQVRDAIQELRRDERTIVITTHNLVEAQELADEIAIRSHGRIIAHGTFRELSAKLLGPPIMELKLRGMADGIADELSGMVEVVSADTNVIRYRTIEPEATNPIIVRRLTELGVEIITLSEIPQSLEQVYLRVVEEAEGGGNGSTDAKRQIA